MKTYRKLPVEVQAVRVTKDNMKDVTRYINLNEGNARYMFNDDRELFGIAIETLEGTMRATPGDYIIQGVQGEFYPCKPDIFWDTYEPVDEQ